MKWRLIVVSCVIRLCYLALKVSFIKCLLDYVVYGRVLADQKFGHPEDGIRKNEHVKMDVWAY